MPAANSTERSGTALAGHHAGTTVRPFGSSQVPRRLAWHGDLALPLHALQRSSRTWWQTVCSPPDWPDRDLLPWLIGWPCWRRIGRPAQSSSTRPSAPKTSGPRGRCRNAGRCSGCSSRRSRFGTPAAVVARGRTRPAWCSNGPETDRWLPLLRCWARLPDRNRASLRLPSPPASARKVLTSTGGATHSRTSRGFRRSCWWIRATTLPVRASRQRHSCVRARYCALGLDHSARPSARRPGAPRVAAPGAAAPRTSYAGDGSVVTTVTRAPAGMCRTASASPTSCSVKDPTVTRSRCDGAALGCSTAMSSVAT